MRIAQICNTFHSVSPGVPHGIYNTVGNLANGLADRGHEVTVFGVAGPGLRVPSVSVVPKTGKERGLSELEIVRENLELLSLCYRRAKDFDIIHSHFSLLGCHFAATSPAVTVHSVHSPVGALKTHLLRYAKEKFISFSLAQRGQIPELNWVANIYHGIDTAAYTFNAEPADYLLYLGRITEEKGVHHAIRAAKKAKVPLVISGMSYPEERYWSEQIEPHIDGVSVRFHGPASMPQKVELMRNARALLFPTLYEEIFGLVMVEAMSCGTPTIGFDNGSVSEIVQDGETGFVVRTEAQMAAAIKKLPTISREACRRRAERYFSVERMVQGYERVYKRLTR